MENQLDELKQKLVQEIKTLSAELAKSNTFVGLLSQESKFKMLHDKFINLKFLEHRNLGLDIFDGPIPGELFDDENENEEENWEENQWQLDTADETTDELDVEVEIFEQESLEGIAESAERQPVENVDEVESFVEENDEQQNDIPEIQEQKSGSIEDEINAYAEDYESYLPKSSNLPKIQIDFNDRMAFLHQLFDGDNEAMELVVNTLNHLETAADSEAYLADLVREMDWQDRTEYIERLQELVQKRFD